MRVILYRSCCFFRFNQLCGNFLPFNLESLWLDDFTPLSIHWTQLIVGMPSFFEFNLSHSLASPHYILVQHVLKFYQLYLMLNNATRESEKSRWSLARIHWSVEHKSLIMICDGHCAGDFLQVVVVIENCVNCGTDQ